VLDHLTKGRVYPGFARGYQDRWVNVLGQQYHAAGAPMDGSATSYPPDFQRLCGMYQEVAAGAGRTLRLGESVGVVRALHFGRTEDEPERSTRSRLSLTR